MSGCSEPLLSKVVWVLGDDPNKILTWARKQIEGLVQKICGSPARFSTQIEDAFCIAVGSPESNRFVREAIQRNLIEMEALGPDDFLLKRTALDDADVLVVAGRNTRAAMYGVFELFEQLGCTFLISRDALPETEPGLTVPSLDMVRQTDCSWRGVLYGGYCFTTNSMMSLRDYKAMFDQMAKMKMNRIIFFHFENEPFIDYAYQGERKLIGDISHPDSGFISYGRHFTGSYRVKDLPVGREKFDRDKIAPLEFQDVRNSNEALDRGRTFMQRLIEMASERGIGTWLTTEPQFVPPNLSKYTRRMPRIHQHWSSHVSCTDPAVTEINRARIEGVLNAYPGLEGIFLGIPEGFFDDPYPESRELVEREWNNYAEALELQKQYWGKFWPGKEQQEAHIRADIAFVEIVKNTIVVAKELKPDLNLGICTICKAYLLTYLDEIFPKEMPFVDFESRALWTLDGAPLHLFKRMEGRECVIVPRAVDDGSLAGLQFPLWQYHQDRFLSSPAENGTRGLMVQTTHIRGNEHSLKFLADGMWNPSLTPEQFYAAYAKRLFGEDAVKPLIEAFAILEHSDEYLGGRGQGNMPWNMVPWDILVLSAFKDFDQPFHKVPFDEGFVRVCQEKAEKFKQAIGHLDQGLDLFAEAHPLATNSGRKELDYLIARTQGYRSHLQVHVQLADLYAHYRDVFRLLEHLGAFKKAFSELVEEARDVEKRAAESARHFADCVEHVTDMAVLWMISHKMVLGSRCLRQFLENILAFYEGREYWKKVDWDLLFGHCPFPAYELEEVSGNETAREYEPG